jgi:hypothetical protein
MSFAADRAGAQHPRTRTARPHRAEKAVFRRHVCSGPRPDIVADAALRNGQDREIIVRVPRKRFEPTLAAVGKIGDVLHRDIQAEDVTDERSSGS